MGGAETPRANQMSGIGAGRSPGRARGGARGGAAVNTAAGGARRAAMAASPAEVLGLPGEEVSEAPGRPPRLPLPSPRGPGGGFSAGLSPLGAGVPCGPAAVRGGAGRGSGVR